MIQLTKLDNLNKKNGIQLLFTNPREMIIIKNSRVIKFSSRSVTHIHWYMFHPLSKSKKTNSVFLKD